MISQSGLYTIRQQDIGHASVPRADRMLRLKDSDNDKESSPILFQSCQTMIATCFFTDTIPLWMQTFAQFIATRMSRKCSISHYDGGGIFTEEEPFSFSAVE
ncbi:MULTISPECIES: hypothetical protein [unclassified Endozoicomonas]|uniref:hypothetical protein n=1 Tax=unclassified Endozoicomonas TaxID=2644528 RepID=UPI002149308E|nr:MULTISPECIES: hypothetical protein [unclassified Endozoicomonas]